MPNKIDMTGFYSQIGSLGTIEMSCGSQDGAALVDLKGRVLSARHDSGKVLKRDAQSCPWVVVKGVPLKSPNEELLVLSYLIGETPFAHEKEGAIVMDIKPLKGKELASSPSYNNSIEFDLHSELPYVQNSPDFLILLCIENPKNIGTRLVSINKILSNICSETTSLIQEAGYMAFIPPHFENENKHAVARPLLVRRKEDYDLHCRYDSLNYVEAKYEQAAELFWAEARRSAMEVSLQPGEALIINNNLSLHGRRGFKGEEGEFLRHLKRVYVYSDTENMQTKFNAENLRISGF